MCCIFQFECSINCHPLSGGSDLVIPTHQSKKLRDPERKISSKRLSLRAGCYTVHGTVSLLIGWMFVAEHSFILPSVKHAVAFSFLSVFFFGLFLKEWFIKRPNICSFFSSLCWTGVSPCLEEFLFQWISMENLSVS